MVTMNPVISPMKKSLAVGVIVAALAVAGFYPYRETLFQPRTPTELSKIFLAFQLYRNKDYKIIYNGNSYAIEAAVGKAKQLLVGRYRGEKAETWVRSHLYRSPDKGKIIYLAFPDGSRRPLRDVLIAELARLFPS
jgi:hypothetical protein